MLKEIEDFTIEFLKESKDRSIRIISHYETDGISSSAILIKTLKRLDKKFSICIIKELTKEFLDKARVYIDAHPDLKLRKEQLVKLESLFS